MPECFSWSYKRVYKDGYIWQDLINDDLLNPFSDNEYVLKGSIIPSAQNKTVEEYFQIKQHMEAEEEEEKEVRIPASDTTQEIFQIDETISPKPPPSGDDSPIKPTISASIFEGNRAMGKWKKEVKMEEERGGNEVAIKKSGSEGKRRTGKGRSEEGRRRRKVDVWRSILKCRIVETKDSAVRVSRERNGSFSQSNRRSADAGGQRRSIKEKKGSQIAAGIYRPVTEPNCSQCGKSFKPEKLHSHMKSCAALKDKGRSRSSHGDEPTAAAPATATGSTRRPSKVTVTVL